jgi:hypothetical protein
VAVGPACDARRFSVCVCVVGPFWVLSDECE